MQMFRRSASCISLNAVRRGSDVDAVIHVDRIKQTYLPRFVRLPHEHGRSDGYQDLIRKV